MHGHVTICPKHPVPDSDLPLFVPDSVWQDFSFKEGLTRAGTFIEHSVKDANVKAHLMERLDCFQAGRKQESHLEALAALSGIVAGLSAPKQSPLDVHAVEHGSVLTLPAENHVAHEDCASSPPSLPVWSFYSMSHLAEAQRLQEHRVATRLTELVKSRHLRKKHEAGIARKIAMSVSSIFG